MVNLFDGSMDFTDGRNDSNGNSQAKYLSLSWKIPLPNTRFSKPANVLPDFTPIGFFLREAKGMKVKLDASLDPFLDSCLRFTLGTYVQYAKPDGAEVDLLINSSLEETYMAPQLTLVPHGKTQCCADTGRGVLSYPFLPVDLFRCLRALRTVALGETRGKSPMSPVYESGGASAFKQLRVMVVEDNVISAELLRRMVVAAGAECSVAADGFKCLDLYFKSQKDDEEEDDDSAFDVIFMDLCMPGMDGITTTRKIREWEEEHSLPAVPIYIVTANALASEDTKCQQARVNGFFMKPISRDTVRGLLRNATTK